MWARRIARTADIPYELSLGDSFPARNRQRGEVPISRNPPIPMLNKDTVAERPHTTHTMGGRPSILGIAHSPGSYRIDGLTVAVGKGNIDSVVPRVCIPGVAGERIGKPPICDGAGIAHTAHRYLIISQHMVYIVNIAVAVPSVGGCLHFRELPGVLLGVAAPRQRPGYVAVSKVIALQGQTDSRDVSRPSSPGLPQIPGDNPCTEVYGFLHAHRRTHRQAHALRALHHIATHISHPAPGFLHHNSRNERDILRDAVRLTSRADLGHEGNHICRKIYIFSGTAAPERSGNGGDQQQGQKKKCRQRSPG